MVGGLEQLFFAHPAGFAFGLRGRVQVRAVVINHLHAKTMGTPAGNALADAPHAQNAQRGAMNVGACKHVIAPFGPQACPQEMLALGQAPRRGHHQGKAEIGGGLGQYVGGVGAQYTARGHGGQVKIVVAHRHVGANLEVHTGRQHLGVQAVSTRGEDAHLALQFVHQLGFGPGLIVLVGFHIKKL